MTKFGSVCSKRHLLEAFCLKNDVDLVLTMQLFYYLKRVKVCSTYHKRALFLLLTNDVDWFYVVGLIEERTCMTMNRNYD